MRRTEIAVGVAVAIVAIGTAVVGVMLLEDQPDHSVDYEMKNKCYPTENLTGHCESEVHVKDFGNAEYVELRAITDHHGETVIRTATESHPFASTTEVYYQNEVIVTAVLESGDRVVLERHQFSESDNTAETGGESAE